jgi:glycosyltransferase involved in cell wall biosynthesis
MKISVLLPTRNRIEYLKYAIESVIRQDYKDWEIIISDNFSEQNIKDYIYSLNDDRIRYYRTDSFISVTDNWNNALKKSTGDYIIMLGDDDGLLNGAFDTIITEIEKNGEPEVIYTGAILFAYPGAINSHKKGYLQSYSYATFFEKNDKSFWLSRNKALSVVKQSFNFKVDFGYNMQFFYFNKYFIEKMKKYGDFFQSPYPDYYTANISFLKSEKILIIPKSLVVIGITAKSFGGYYNNNDEKTGSNFLKNIPELEIKNKLKRIVLPGSDMNNSWLYSMETIKQNLKNEINLKLNYEKYRKLQIYQIYSNYFNDKYHDKCLYKILIKNLNLIEKMKYFFFKIYLIILGKINKKILSTILEKYYQRIKPYMSYIPPLFEEGKYQNILDFFYKNFN